jgi:hypothetical protein
MRPGQTPRSISEEVALDLVMLTHGSPAAVLGFNRSQSQGSFPETDFGLEILEKAMTGLTFVQSPGDTYPAGSDKGVLMAWRDAGVVFSQKVSKIEFTLNHRENPIITTFTPDGFTQIQNRIRGPETNIRTVEGRLVMVDFKEHGRRCRIHPSTGEPVLCLFDDELKGDVFDNILKYVSIVGEAKEDPDTGKITSIKIHDIERLEGRENESTNLLPQGTPISRSFWESPTLDELANYQNVAPMTDVRALFGTWPGEEDDGFEDAIDELRHRGKLGENES